MCPIPPATTAKMCVRKRIWITFFIWHVLEKTMSQMHWKEIEISQSSNISTQIPSLTCTIWFWKIFNEMWFLLIWLQLWNARWQSSRVGNQGLIVLRSKWVTAHHHMQSYQCLHPNTQIVFPHRIHAMKQLSGIIFQIKWLVGTNQSLPHNAFHKQFDTGEIKREWHGSAW